MFVIIVPFISVSFVIALINIVPFSKESSDPIFHILFPESAMGVEFMKVRFSE